MLPPRWPSGKAFSSRAVYQGSIPAVAVNLFRNRVILLTGKMVVQWLSGQAASVMRSALGLVGPVSVYYG